MENPYIVYVNNNDSGYITAVNSSAFLPDTEGWKEIDRGYGDKYHHAQGNLFRRTSIRCGIEWQHWRHKQWITKRWP